jgi:hypothetical protein
LIERVECRQLGSSHVLPFDETCGPTRSSRRKKTKRRERGADVASQQQQQQQQREQIIIKDSFFFFFIFQPNKSGDTKLEKWKNSVIGRSKFKKIKKRKWLRVFLFVRLTCQCRFPQK